MPSPAFAYLTPDRVLSISRTGQKTQEYPLRLVSSDNLRRLAIVLNSENYQKSVELDERDLTPTVYFFRQTPFLIPTEFVTDHPVELHGASNESFDPAVRRALDADFEEDYPRGEAYEDQLDRLIRSATDEIIRSPHK